MYHSRTVDNIKQYVLKSINQIDSNLRVLIAINAVGMGLDFQCNFVINFGPPSEFDDYLQQIGRVGRDGCESYSMLLYHGQQLQKKSAEMLYHLLKIGKLVDDNSLKHYMVTRHLILQ